MKNKIYLFLLLSTSVAFSQTYDYDLVNAEDGYQLEIIGNVVPIIEEVLGVKTNKIPTDTAVRYKLNEPIIIPPGGTSEFRINFSGVTGSSLIYRMEEVDDNSANGNNSTYVKLIDGIETINWTFTNNSSTETKTYDEIYLKSALNSNNSNFGDDIYVHSIKAEIANQKQIDLESGNVWYDYHNNSSNEEVYSQLTRTSSAALTLTTVAIPVDNFNNSHVYKVDRSDTNAFIRYTYNGLQQNIGNFKFRAYIDGSVEDINGEALSVKVFMKHVVENKQISSPAIELEPGFWNDINVDLSTLSVNNSTNNEYNYVEIRFNQSHGIANATYYIESIQGPNLGTASTDKINATNDIVLYPNPVKSSFKLSRKVDSIKIYSLLGNLIKIVNVSNTAYDVSELAAGIYYVETSYKNQKKILKFVKQ